jgi:hypothetical protein
MAWATPTKPQSTTRLGSWSPASLLAALLSWAFALSIEALAGGLPMLSQRGYRIGSEQGIVVLAAAVIDQRYRWVVTLEVPIIVEIDDVPVVQRKVVDRFRLREFVMFLAICTSPKRQRSLSQGD